MACDNVYVNNIPLGLSYHNISNRPVGVSELQNLSVSNVSASFLIADNFDLSALNSVSIPTPEDGHALIFVSSTGTWQSGYAGSAAGVSNLNGLADVTITAAALNQLLQFNGVAWINQELSSVVSSYVTTATNSTLSSTVAVLESYVSDNEAAWLVDTTDHGALTGLTDNDHPQYVLSATNASLSSLVSNIETSTIGLSSIVSNLQASTASVSSYANSVSSYISANEASWTATSPRIVVQYHCDGGESLTLLEHPNSAQFLANSDRNIQRYDLSAFSQCRFSCRVLTGTSSVNFPRLIAKAASTFSTTIGDYFDIGNITGSNVEVSAALTTVGINTSGWIDLDPPAQADIFLAVFQNGGDTVESPVIGPVSLEFR